MNKAENTPVSYSRGIMALEQIKAERAKKRTRPSGWPVKMAPITTK